MPNRGPTHILRVPNDVPARRRGSFLKHPPVWIESNAEDHGRRCHAMFEDHVGGAGHIGDLGPP
jgi:hypothetical protein